MGENLNLQRALVASPPDGEKIAVSCHPDGAFGKYGAVVFYRGWSPSFLHKFMYAQPVMERLRLAVLRDSETSMFS